MKKKCPRGKTASTTGCSKL